VQQGGEERGRAKQRGECNRVVQREERLESNEVYYKVVQRRGIEHAKGGCNRLVHREKGLEQREGATGWYTERKGWRRGSWQQGTSERGRGRVEGSEH
jgi:hypothetical protein